jgi:hypothetical protein
MPSLSKPVERIGIGVADARRHDLDQHFARSFRRPSKIELDDSRAASSPSKATAHCAGLHAGGDPQPGQAGLRNRRAMTTCPPGSPNSPAGSPRPRTRRGAARVDPPEQEVERDAAGRFTLRFRPFARSERRNAALSLATNLAVADMLAARTGLFRVMAPPDAAPRNRCAAPRGVWTRLAKQPCRCPVRAPLDPADPRDGGLHAGDPPRRERGRAMSRIAPAQSPGTRRWPRPMPIATAPLRRLADRYVLRAALAVANGQPVPGGGEPPRSSGCPAR